MPNHILFSCIYRVRGSPRRCFFKRLQKKGEAVDERHET